MRKYVSPVPDEFDYKAVAKKRNAEEPKIRLGSKCFYIYTEDLKKIGNPSTVCIGYNADIPAIAVKRYNQMKDSDSVPHYNVESRRKHNTVRIWAKAFLEDVSKDSGIPLDKPVVFVYNPALSNAERLVFVISTGNIKGYTGLENTVYTMKRKACNDGGKK